MRSDSPCLWSWVLVSVCAIGMQPAEAQPVGTDGPQQTERVSRVPAATGPSAGSLRRIHRGLESTLARAASGALRVDVELQVFGVSTAPAMLEPGDLVVGAPVYGAPTRDEMLTLLTPAPFRSTAAFRHLRPAVTVGR
jgi:hypothetical protein